MTLQDTSQRTDQKEQNEIANKIIKTQIKIITAAYDKAIAYTNVIVVAGYAAFFGLWTLTKPYLSEKHALWAALFMCISATIFVLFEVFKMAFTAESLNTQYATFSKRIKGKKAQEVLAGIQKLEDASGKASLTFVRVWRISFYIVVATGLVGVGILMFAFLHSLFPRSATDAWESVIMPKGGVYMALGQQIIGTMIGTIAGFLFSLCLFWIREKWAKSSAKKFLRTNVLSEIDYNVRLLTQVKDGLNECIEKVTAGSKDTYCIINYGRLAKFFIQNYYQSGLIREKWEIDDIDKLDNIMITYSIGMEEYVLRGLDNWRKGAIEQKEALNILSFEKNNLERHIKDLEDLKEKLKEV